MSRVIVIANNGPVNSVNADISFLVGSLNLGSMCFFLSALIMNPQLNSVAKDVAAAAPAHPHRTGHTQSKKSPIILTTAASPIILSGVMASCVAIITDKETACANAAQAIDPLQYMYDAAGPRKAGVTFSILNNFGVKSA